MLYEVITGKVTLIKAITVMKKNLDLASQGDLTVRMEVNIV